jgi:DpnII restriction endonuclease
MLEPKTPNRHVASLIEPFPVFTPSPEAIQRIEALDPTSNALETAAVGKDQLQELYDILVQDQSTTGLRVHKGFPLYWLAQKLGNSDKEKALQFMLQAFVEDVLTHGHRASQGFAAGSLTEDFGFSAETLMAFKEFVMDKTKATFHPSPLVAEFFSAYKGDTKPTRVFEGVSTDSAYDSLTTQIKESIRNHLRPSFRVAPTDETQVQNVVLALLRQIDSKTEREVGGIRLAGKEYAVDFSLFLNKIGVEVKLLRDKTRLGKMIDEIVADITPYIHVFKRMIFVVYDASAAINDTSKFVADIKGNRKEVEVLVV